MYYGVTQYSYEDFKIAIEKYIKYYNDQRIKKKLRWMSPVENRLTSWLQKISVAVKTTTL